MSRFHSYLHTASRLIRDNGGQEPFSLFLKKFFSQEKKYGSRDRKIISSIAYSYYRTGHALGRSPTEENLLHALFLCGSDGQGTLAQLAPALQEKLQLSAEQRLGSLGLKAIDIFPHHIYLSDQIDRDAYCLSLLEQPDLFLRIRPGKESVVMNKLSGSGLLFEKTGQDTLRLPNQSAVDAVLDMNRDAVVQDYASQQVLGQLVENKELIARGKVAAWDCCAASGGKSILLHDRLAGQVHITISDIRESMLANAKKRIREAGIGIQGSFVADLTIGNSVPAGKRWPLIMADMPCTGSGTWARTPEQSYYFDLKNLDHYAERQARILQTVSRHLSTGGWLFYITCSVFQAENEGLLDQILPNTGLTLKSQRYISGMNQKADSMFVAILSHS